MSRKYKPNEQEIDRSDYVRAWRGNQYLDDNPETYYVEKEHPRHENVKRNKYRQEWEQRESSDHAKGDKKHYRDDAPNDFETYAYEYKAQTYSRSPSESGDRRRERNDTKAKEKHTSSTRKRHQKTDRKASYEKEDRSEFVHEVSASSCRH